MKTKSNVYVRWLSATTIVQNLNHCVHTHYFLQNGDLPM